MMGKTCHSSANGYFDGYANSRADLIPALNELLGLSKAKNFYYEIWRNERDDSVFPDGDTQWDALGNYVKLNLMEGKYK